MSSIAYYNGTISNCENARIGLSDRAIYFGDGVYDVMLAGGGGTYQKGLHIERLKRNAERLEIDVPKELESAVDHMIKTYAKHCSAIYVQLSRSASERIHAPSVHTPSNLLITVSDAHIDQEPTPISAVTADDVRYRMCDVKTLNLLPSVLATIRAAQSGCEEAIFIRDGIVTEGAKSNLFIVKNGILYTHPLGWEILPGITRENVIRIASLLGIQCREVRFDRDALFSADEIFITSTTKLLRQITVLDGVRVGRTSELCTTVASLLYNEANLSIR